MPAFAGQDHHPNLVRIVDPLKDIDYFTPERGVHGVDLVRPVDRYMGDLVLQLHTEGLVFSHAIILDSRGTSVPENS